MKNNLRVGVVGFGVMGRNHARVLSTLNGVNLVGVYDPKACEHGNQVNRHFENLEDLINQDLDYAVVATPTNSHSEVALMLAENGIHTLIEKPLADNSSSAMDIVETFRRKGLIAAVGHIERFNPAVREARNRLDLLGPLHQVATRRQGPFPGRISDVGVIKDLATHDIDVTSWITEQDYKSISAISIHKSAGSNEDLMASVCTLSEGTITNHLVNWLSPMKERKMILTGENGSFEIDTLSADLTYYQNGTTKNEWQEIARFRGVTEGDVTRIALEKREPLLIEHENFRDAILGKSSEIVSLMEGFKTLRVAEGMLESTRLNGEVQVLIQ
jgi:UDP-N-acetylglucosamine 3-dehydrogenase